MKREEKAATVAGLREKFIKAKLAILTECSGMPVNQLTQLRRQLRNAQAEFCVVKNTMAVRATEGTSLVPVESLFQGQTAVVIGYDDPVLPARLVRDFIKEEKCEQKIKFKVGVLEGRVLQADQLYAAANVPPRQELLAMLVSALQGPIRRLVMVFQGTLRGLFGALMAIQERKKGEAEMATAESKLSRDELIQAVEKMSVLELSELVKGLEERFGVTAAAPVGGVAAPTAGAAAGPAVEEQTSFNVVLVSVPADKKIQIIKVVREITGLGLKEAKDLVEGAPKPVKEDVAKEESESIKKKLQEVGATVEVK